MVGLGEKMPCGSQARVASSPQPSGDHHGHGLSSLLSLGRGRGGAV